MMTADNDRIRYTAAVGDFFSSTKWGLTLVLTTVAQFIPILGPIIWLGWLCEVADHWHENPGTPHPDFTFDRFSQYMSRGIWVFLVAFVAMFVLMPLLYIAGGLPFLLLLIDVNACTVIPAVVLSMTFMMTAGVLIGGVLSPVIIRATLTRSFGQAFSLDFVSNFIRKVWLELLLSILFINVFAIFACIAGYALCIVGIYPAMTLVAFASWHLHFQLYHLYLSRGGMPVPRPAIAPSPAYAPRPPQ